MRNWAIVLTIVVGVASTAHAKRLVCTPPLPAPENEHALDGTRGTLAAPVVRGVTFSVEGASIDAEFPLETARVRLTYVDGTGPIDLWTTPARPFVCIPRVPVTPVLVSIFVFDEQGHTNMAVANGSLMYERHRGCGMGETFLFLSAIPFGLIVMAILLFIRSMLRRRKLRRPGDAVSPLVAEAIVRAVITHVLVCIAVGVTSSTLLYVTDHPVSAALVAWFSLSCLVQLAMTRRFSRELERDQPALLHGNVLATLGDHIVVPRWILRRALRQGVPVAAVI